MMMTMMMPGALLVPPVWCRGLRRLLLLLQRRRRCSLVSVIVVVVVVVNLFVRTSTRAQQGALGGGVRCPSHYWDIPSGDCSSPLYAVLERIDSNRRELTPDIVDNICTKWDETHACYQQLLRHCTAAMPGAFEELSTHINRLVIFSGPCQAPFQHGLRSIECYLPFVSTIQTCTEAFDKEYKNSVAFRQFKNACRVITVTLKCYHGVKTKMQTSCHSSDVAKMTSSYDAVKFDDFYIRPVVDQTRRTVRSFCSLNPPYDQYYNRRSQVRSRVVQTALLASLVLVSHLL